MAPVLLKIRCEFNTLRVRCCGVACAGANSQSSIAAQVAAEKRADPAKAAVANGAAAADASVDKGTGAGHGLSQSVGHSDPATSKSGFHLTRNCIILRCPWSATGDVKLMIAADHLCVPTL